MNHKQVKRLRKVMKGATPAEWRAAKKRFARLPAPKKRAFWELMEA